MNTIRAVVRRLMDGISYTIIKADTGVSKGFISRVNTVLHTLEITPEQFLKQTDDEIHNAIYPPRVDSWQDPDGAAVNELLKKPHFPKKSEEPKSREIRYQPMHHMHGTECLLSIGHM